MAKQQQHIVYSNSCTSVHGVITRKTNTPSKNRTNLQADALGNGESANGERSMRLRNYIDDIIPHSIVIVVCPPPVFSRNSGSEIHPALRRLWQWANVRSTTIYGQTALLRNSNAVVSEQHAVGAAPLGQQECHVMYRHVTCQRLFFFGLYIHIYDVYMKKYV